MAAMTKYVMEHPDKAKDNAKIRLNATKILLNYCEDTANNIKMGKGLKKLSAAKAKGTLSKTLESW
jgi:hypothetical protein